jgi:hypothetical protein
MVETIELDLQLTPQEYAENLQKTFKNAYKHVSENRDIKMDQNLPRSISESRQCRRLRSSQSLNTQQTIRS